MIIIYLLHSLCQRHIMEFSCVESIVSTVTSTSGMNTRDSTVQLWITVAVFKAQHGVTRTARSLGFCLKTKQERRHVTSCCSGGCISLCDIVRARHSGKEWKTCRRQGGEQIKRWNSGCAWVRGIPSVRDCNQLVVSTPLQQRAEAFIQEIISWLQLFNDIFLRFCSLGEMGPHSVVPCSAELQEKSQHTNKMEWRNTAEYEQWRRPALDEKRGGKRC